MKETILAFAIISIVLLNPYFVKDIYASECRCTSRSPEQLAEASDAVFIGKVDRVARRGEVYVAYFDVTKSIKGYQPEDKEFEVLTKNIEDEGECGYRFKAGSEYFVYTDLDREGSHWTTKCSGTKPLSEASRDEKELKKSNVVIVGENVSDSARSSGSSLNDAVDGSSQIVNSAVTALGGTVLIGATILILMNAGVGMASGKEKDKHYPPRDRY